MSINFIDDDLIVSMASQTESADDIRTAFSDAIADTPSVATSRKEVGLVLATCDIAMNDICFDASCLIISKKPSIIHDILTEIFDFFSTSYTQTTTNFILPVTNTSFDLATVADVLTSAVNGHYDVICTDVDFASMSLVDFDILRKSMQPRQSMNSRLIGFHHTTPEPSEAMFRKENNVLQVKVGDIWINLQPMP